MGQIESHARLPEHELQKLRNELGMDCVNYYNFAVCGVTGTGKSSLVNGICGYKERDSRAAPVGHFEVGTREARVYKPQKYPHVAIWDIPGTNRVNCPFATYFAEQRLAAFDVLLIVSDTNRTAEIDFTLAKQAQSAGVMVIFVRTKGDCAVDQELKKAAMMGRSTTETTQQVAARVKRSIKTSMQAELEKVEMGTKLFVVVSACAFLDNNGPWPVLDESNLIEQIEALAKSRYYK